MEKINALAFGEQDTTLQLLPMRATDEVQITYSKEAVKDYLERVHALYEKLPDITINTLRQSKKEIYYSCKMEGAVSTVAKSINLLSDKNSTPADMSEQMIRNYFELIHNPPVASLFENVLEIRKLWDVLSKNAITSVDKGYPFRSGPVYVYQGGHKVHEGLDSNLIEQYMEVLYNYLNTTSEDPIIVAIILHFFMEHYHIFADCNGRTGRFMMTEWLDYKGYVKFKATPINFILSLDKLNYDYSLRLFKQHDITRHISYMLGVMYKALLMSRYVNMGDDLGEFLRGLPDSLLPTSGVSLQILDELDKEGLLEDGQGYVMPELIPELGDAIKYYQMGMYD